MERDPKTERTSENDELKAWYKPSLDKVVQEMIKLGVVSGAAVEAAPIWAAPSQWLIAKVWGAGQANKFIWTISGDDVVSDYIPGSMADNPRDVAKHFALKWQMNADQIMHLADNRPMTLDAQSKMKSRAEKLIRHAESLYDLTTQEDIWALRDDSR